MAKMRSFASRYSSSEPWRSRWSGSMFSSTATSGAKAIVSSNWKLDTSQTTVAPGSMRPARERHRRADVAGHGHRRAGRPVHGADQLDCGRLSVRAGHRDELVRHEPPAQLQLAKDLHAGNPGMADHGRVPRDAGTLDDRCGRRRCLQKVDSIRIQMNFDARPRKPFCIRQRLGRTPRVAGDDPLVRPRGAQRQRRRDARAREPYDQVGPGRKRRALTHRCSAGRA